MDFQDTPASLETYTLPTTIPTTIPTTASANSRSKEMLAGRQLPVEKLACSVLVCSEMAEHSLEGRTRYSRTSGEVFGSDVERRGFDLHGSTLEQNVKTDIKSNVDSTLMNQMVEDECFYLVHTNVFCLTAEGGVVPAELSLARMSLRKGVEEVYQVFIEPGTLPKGYRAYCTENSKATHKIPLDLVLFSGNYQQIVEDMLEFLPPPWVPH